MATLVKIDKLDRDIIERELLYCRINPKFYTIESNDSMLLCEIDCDSPDLLWSLGKVCGHAISQKIFLTNQ